MRTNRVLLVVIPIILVAIVGIALFVSQTPVSQVQAQQTPMSMRSLLERLRARMDSDPAFTASIQFVNPLIPNEPAWVIPAPLSEEGSSRRFGEIGDDYVCFAELGQTFNDSVCVPYSNIMLVIFDS